MSKYANLELLKHTQDVPTFTSLSSDDYAELWSNYLNVLSYYEDISNSIVLTAAAFLDSGLEKLNHAPDLIWSDTADTIIRDRLSSVSLSPSDTLAIRSSSAEEDSGSNSFAGVFDTKLNIVGIESIKNAIQSVWLSSYSKVAFIEKLRANSLSGVDNMTIVLQQLVTPELAGIAFSHDPVTGESITFIESVESIGESLVSGEERGSYVRIKENSIVDNSSFDSRHVPVYMRVSRMIAEISKTFVTGCDIEWAYDGDKVWLLQARPITSIKAKEIDQGPLFMAVDLYTPDKEKLTPYKPLPEFAQHFRSKRTPLVHFARRHDVEGGSALLIKLNQEGASLPETAQLLEDNINEAEVVIDISSNIRQLILPTNELIDRLQQLLTTESTVIVVRGFRRGSIGLITYPIKTTDNSSKVFCEVSSEGLLAMNRGTAQTETFIIGPDTTEVDSPLPAEIGMSSHTIRKLYAATCSAVEQFGSAQFEWILKDDRLSLLDFSKLDDQLSEEYTKDKRVISSGYASGVPILVNSSTSIEEISIAANVSLTDEIPKEGDLGPLMDKLLSQVRNQNSSVIVVSPRPYAALAALIPYSDGFVFESASVLCHLSILLREHGVPAVESSTLYHQASELDNMTIDTS